MNVKELVIGLKDLTRCYPVVLMKENETLGLSREFFNDGYDWAEISLITQDPMNLDTDFLKHILDYCAKQEFRSLFSELPQFENYEVSVQKPIPGRNSAYKQSIIKYSIETIDGGEEVFALHVESLFEDDESEEPETIE